MISVAVRNGLGNTVATPTISRVCCWWAVISTTGMPERLWSRIFTAKNSSPFITGIITSRSTTPTSGRARSSSSACFPFSATSTEWSSSWRISRSESRMAASSSTTRTWHSRAFMGDPDGIGTGAAGFMRVERP